jgi:acyl-CoA synthetase (AMP-forming)/AMP-acid ligase II
VQRPAKRRAAIRQSMHITTPKTVTELLRAGADSAPAIGAPGRTPMTYAELRDHVDNTVRCLNALGVGRNDPVAIVLPNGAEMAAAFVALASACTTAPLNPAYREDEYEFYLTDLGTKLLVVPEGTESPARSVAKRLGIGVVELRLDKRSPAGLFELHGESIAAAPNLGGNAGPDDIALVLHTSGTTSRPKQVPLSQLNICASAKHIVVAIGLTATDRCLNIMPLFHIHGLVAAELCSLAAGASVICTPGFNALQFFNWLKETKPTWYTGVPTVHQAIVARAARNKSIVEAARLRLIRSSSSSLPPQVMQALEQTFNAPVIEAYGMTEAAHQITSNPLPPGKRKPGHVGVAAGPELAIMNNAGELLPNGAVGEVVIRGPNVTLGYRNNPQANADAFVNGWFRTGDQGVIDGDGYLRLTGRLKEIINRGGEKISPREIDEVLLDHPAIEQAVAFAVPHEKLGEDVAVAIVLRDNHELSEREVRAFAAEHLADFKVPSKVVFLDEIPKGATGKLQRIGLAEKLGLA